MEKLYITNKPRYLRRAKWKARGVSDVDLADEIYEKRIDCYICGSTERDKLFIDHCHKTGEVRGTLCRNCNIALGLLKDDVDLLKRSIDYLTPIVYN